jgi:UrcA family protein
MTMTPIKAQRWTLPAAFAVVAFATLNATAGGAELNQITVRSSHDSIVGYQLPSLTPIVQSTVRLDVSYNPVVLTTNSGVALLKDAVTQAAYKACGEADPSAAAAGPVYGNCIRQAIDQAQPQIARAIARARSTVNG